MSASQVEQIRAHLVSGRDITPLEALHRFGCLRLAARVADLRAQGIPVETVAELANGKRFARYRLASPQGVLL
jgi:hypothetical protein